METLTGKRDVFLLDGRAVTVSQIPLREYAGLLKNIDDEFAIVAASTGLKADEVLSLQPTDYETLQSAVQEVNQRGFFAYATRRQETAMARMNRTSPEVLRFIAEKVSASSLPGLQPK